MTKQELKEYYSRAQAEGKSVREAADDLCVSDAAVRQYCKLHSIELRKVGNVGRGPRW